MSASPTELESNLESSVIDVGAIPLAALRTLDGAVVRRSLRHVVERTAHVGVTEVSSDNAID
jgi:FXSXX-COOH protein